MSAIPFTYQPFKGYSAWFSESVKPSSIEQWNLHGGEYASETSADFLFSNNAATSDTVSLYRSGSSLCVFRPEWITAVIEGGGNLTSVLIAKYVLLPPYCITPTTITDHNITCTPQLQSLFNTNNASQLIDVKGKTYDCSIPLKYKTSVNTSGFTRTKNTKSCQISLQINDEHLKGVTHINSYGRIDERLIDAIPGKNGLVVTKRK